MRISKIELKNYYQHRNLTVNLTGGLIGVTGDNGSGKTNLVTSVAEVITGVFSKKKQKIITYGERQGSATIELEMPDSSRVRVSRDLQGSGCSLIATDPSGKEYDWSPATSVESVNAKMEEIFPYPATVLKGVIFTPQRDITSLLFDPKSSIRERMAMSLFGIEKAELVEAKVAEILSDIPVESPPHGYQPASEIKGVLIPQAKRDLLAHEKEHAALEERVSDLKAKAEKMKLEKVDPAKEWVRFYEASAVESSINSSIFDIKQEINGLRKSVEEGEAELEGVDLPDMKDMLQQAKALEAAEDEVAEAARNLEFVKNSSVSWATPENAEELKASIIAARDETISLSSRIAKTQQQIQARKLISSGGAEEECPTCLRSGLSDEDVIKIAEASKDLPDLERELVRELAKTKKEEADLEKKLWAVNDAISGEERDLKSANSRIEKADKWHEEVKSIIDEKWGRSVRWEKIAAVIETATEAISELSHTKRSLKNKELKLVSLKEELESLKGQDAPHNPLNLTSATEAMKIIESYDRTREEYLEERSRISGSQAKLGNLQADIEDLSKSLKSFEDFENRRTEAEKSRRFISAVRSVFHYSAAPKKVVSVRVKAVSKRINDYLEDFEAGFRVDARDGFDFDCVFGGRVLGKIMSPQELSGGEQVILSVAFRLAAAETFCAGVGFLILDEPTVWLDKKRVSSLPRVMERLAKLAKKNGTQYIVITHDPSIMGCFDQIIEIEAEANK